jgi:hypothetical protein
MDVSCLKSKQGKVVPFHTMTVYKESKSMAIFILNLSTGWWSVVSVRPSPLYILERIVVPIA